MENESRVKGSLMSDCGGRKYLKSLNLPIGDGESLKAFEERITRMKVAFYKNHSGDGAVEGLDWREPDGKDA